MPQYFFNVASASETVRDEEGSDLADLNAAREEAVKDARSLMSNAILEGRDISSRFIQISGEMGRSFLSCLSGWRSFLVTSGAGDIAAIMDCVI